MGSITECVRDIRFKNWVKEATDRALTEPVPNTDVDAIIATPTVFVNGLQYVGVPGDAQAFSTFVVQAAGQSFAEDTETPVPTDTGVPAETAVPTESATPAASETPTETPAP
jgi:hypothetical protein